MVGDNTKRILRKNVPVVKWQLQMVARKDLQTETLVHVRGGGGDSLTLGTGSAFGVDEIIWDLEFRGPKCAICGPKFGVG